MIARLFSLRAPARTSAELAVSLARSTATGRVRAPHAARGQPALEVGQLDQVLRAALAVGGLAHDDSAAVFLESAGEDLGRAGRLVGEEHGDRQGQGAACRPWAARP